MMEKLEAAGRVEMSSSWKRERSHHVALRAVLPAISSRPDEEGRGQDGSLFTLHHRRLVVGWGLRETT